MTAHAIPRKEPGAVRGALRALGRAVAGADYPGVRLPAAAIRPRLSPLLLPVVALVLTGLCAATAQYLIQNRPMAGGLAWTIGVLTVAPLAVIIRRPLTAWRLAVVALLLGTFNWAPDDALPWNPVQILVTIAVLLVVATRADGPVVGWIGVLTTVVVLLFVDLANAPGVVVLIGFLLVLGQTVRRVGRVQGALAAQTEVSEREQARRAVLEERARIARELHDVVAHHMSMLAVRAETAPYRLTGVPEPVRAEFGALAQAARDALTDMRRLLGVLRSDAAAPELAPQPDLAAVTTLVDAARRAGMDIHYLPPVAGAERRPPDAVALAGYRIVQEALANATRHAPGAPVTVQLWPGARELAVRVHNGPSARDGAAPPADAAAAPTDAAADPAADPAAGPDGADGADGGTAVGGHGVAGMRERAELLGGDFNAEPTADGGFSVVATLPYGDGPAGADTGDGDPAGHDGGDGHDPPADGAGGREGAG
jgi:signal transduction histidine kinase